LSVLNDYKGTFKTINKFNCTYLSDNNLWATANIANKNYYKLTNNYTTI